VNPVLSHLLDVQRIDAKIDALQKQRAVYPQKLDELGKKLAVIHKELETLQAQLGEKEKERRTLDNTLQLDITKLKKWEARLVEIRNQREYLALSREIEGQKKQNTESQERLTAMTAEITQLTEKLEGLRDEVAVQEIDLETEKTAVEKKVSEFDGQIGEHDKERGEFLSQVPPQLLKRYDQIRQKRGGTALAAAEKGRCTACNVSLPPQLYNIIIRGETIEACPSCHRILYYRDTTKDEQAAAQS
jgi:predicted  nucleic acid-binding Zn-ribbon protein